MHTFHHSPLLCEVQNGPKSAPVSTSKTEPRSRTGAHAPGPNTEGMQMSPCYITGKSYGRKENNFIEKKSAYKGKEM